MRSVYKSYCKHFLQLNLEFKACYDNQNIAIRELIHKCRPQYIKFQIIIETKLWQKKIGVKQYSETDGRKAKEKPKLRGML